MADELEEISLSDDSGIGSSTEDMDAENSGQLKTDTLPKKIMETKVATVKGFEETAADATVGRACKATGKVYLAPAERYWSTIRDRPVKLRMNKSGPGSEPPLTVHQMFQLTVDNYGDHPALCSKKNGPWVALSYKEYQQQCRAAAKSFLKLGLERFHGVGILGFNAPEWFIADIGCIMAGGLAAGIYTTNSPEACHYVAHDSEANVLVVEDDKQLDKILQVRHKLPHLKAIVQYKGEVKNKMKNIYSWTEFMKIGKGISDAKLDAVINSQRANECCTIIYTSGTTGDPKGVMLSHDNITWTANVAGSVVNLKNGKDSVVSYLPLSHVAAQMNDMWISLRFAGTTYFAQPGSLEASLITVLRDVRPTSFLGVPRVWEQMQEAMKDNSVNSSFMKKKIGEWAKRIGLQAIYNVMNNNPSVPCGFTLANKLVFRRVRASLGLDCCKTCFSGAAPMTKDILEYFMSLNIPIYELYGMSESTGPHTMSWSDNFRIMSCGKEIPGCKTKVDKPDADGNGELCFWGRHVFMGYMNMADKTEETIDSKGWLHSGDLGKHDIDDFLYITGRIKELIITAGGENIPPVPIEDAVKKELPIISNAMLVGDKRKSLSMLLTLKCKVDAYGDPTDELAPLAVEFCRKHGVMVNKVSEIIRNKEPVIYKVIQEGVDKVNAKAMSKAQKVLKWGLLSHDFSVSGGELGPTMNLKRPVVSQMYKEEINKFYKV